MSNLSYCNRNLDSILIIAGKRYTIEGGMGLFTVEKVYKLFYWIWLNKEALSSLSKMCKNAEKKKNGEILTNFLCRPLQNMKIWVNALYYTFAKINLKLEYILALAIILH